MEDNQTNRLICIPPDDVQKLWPVVLPMVEAAYREVDEFLPDNLLEALKDGRLLLWVSAPDDKIVAALITALLPHPSGLACKLMVCGGSEMGSWLSGGHDQIEAFARAEGCAKMFMEGRRSWSRVLPGYETKRVMLEKRL